MKTDHEYDDWGTGKEEHLVLCEDILGRSGNPFSGLSYTRLIDLLLKVDLLCRLI